MSKKIIKEITISLLLCLAIILLLGILLYDYVPMTKTIPNPVSYSTPDNVKQELAQTQTVDESQVIMTYEVDSTDLNNYKNIQDYKPGKANPFSSFEPTESTNGTNTTNNNSSIGGTTNSGTSNGGVVSGDTGSTNTNNTADSGIAGEENKTTTSGGQFFQDKGTK